MTEKTSSEDTIIKVSGSRRHTLNSIAYAVASDRELTVANPYPNIDLDYYNRALNRQSYVVEYDDESLKIKKNADYPGGGVPLPCFDIDDPVGLLLALKFGDKISFAKETSEDFERKILILRRMGVKFAERHNDSKTCMVEEFQPVKIKFNFQESNFYLARYVACLTVLGGPETEFLSRINVVSSLPQGLYPFMLEIENLRKVIDETDELERRLQKLKKDRTEVKYHHKIKCAEADFPDKISLPGDPVVASMAAVISLLTRKDNIKVGPLGRFENEKTFVNILSKFGISASIKKTESGSFFEIEPGKTAGRKIDENQMRAFPKAFGAISVLASFSTDKTILRGLPTSSSLWQERISGVAAILASAGVRVGEVEDGFVIEPPSEFTDISYHEFNDPYLQLVQLAAAIAINARPLTSEFFSAYKYYPQFQACLDKIRPRAKTLAS